MTTQTIVFIIAYLLGISVAFRAGKQYWIRRFVGDGYTLVKTDTLEALANAAECLDRQIQRLNEGQNPETKDQNDIS